MRPVDAGRDVSRCLLGVLAGAGLAGCTGRAEPPRVPPPPTVTWIEWITTGV